MRLRSQWLSVCRAVGWAYHRASRSRSAKAKAGAGGGPSNQTTAAGSGGEASTSRGGGGPSTLPSGAAHVCSAPQVSPPPADSASVTQPTDPPVQAASSNKQEKERQRKERLRQRKIDAAKEMLDVATAAMEEYGVRCERFLLPPLVGGGGVGGGGGGGGGGGASAHRAGSSGAVTADAERCTEGAAAAGAGCAELPGVPRAHPANHTRFLVATGRGVGNYLLPRRTPHLVECLSKLELIRQSSGAPAVCTKMLTAQGETVLACWPVRSACIRLVGVGSDVCTRQGRYMDSGGRVRRCGASSGIRLAPPPSAWRAAAPPPSR